MPNILHLRFAILILAVTAFCHPERLAASELRANNGDQLFAVSLSGGNCLAGAIRANSPAVQGSGAAYLFRQVQAAAGIDTEELKLVPSDPTLYGAVGYYLSLSGNMALAAGYDYTSVGYLYRHLDSATGTITESARLASSNGSALHDEVSLSGSNALIGLLFFKNLDTASGRVTESATLQASDEVSTDNFGVSSSLSGRSALVGAYTEEHGGRNQGAAYYYRDLGLVAGTVTETAKLVAPGDGSGVYFGQTVSLDGNSALVGAPFKNTAGLQNRGEVYYFRNLDRAKGLVTTNVRLLASNAADLNSHFLNFGGSLSLSGDNALIGLSGTRGGAYLFRRLTTASAEIYEDVELISSRYARSSIFGHALNLAGDDYVISDSAPDNGTAVYTGSISALTTLDFGNSFKTNIGVTFNSRVDWIIGKNTDANQIDLLAGDGATVMEAGKAVYIGKNAGSNDNLLDIAGTLKCNFLYIGSPAGNVNNVLQLERTALLNAGAIRLANGNRLLIAGDQNTARKFLATTRLQVWIGGAWVTVTEASYGSLIRVNENGGYTVIVPVQRS